MLNDSTSLSIAINVLVSKSSALRLITLDVGKYLIAGCLAAQSALRRFADGEVILLGGMLEQHEIEHQVLSSTAGLEQCSYGLAEHEALALHEIRTEL